MLFFRLTIIVSHVFITVSLCDVRLSHLNKDYLLTSRLDYANSVLYRIPAKYISRLQRTQNTLARVVAGNRTPGSNLATLSKLHWLPVHDRIKFKIATMTHKIATMTYW